MNFDTLFKLLPLMPDIQKMLAVIERFENDPDVKAAIVTAQKVAAILAQPSAHN